MLDGGADPSPWRAADRMATEDIGLADPRALRPALDAAETYERLGSPRANWRWRSGGVPGGGAQAERGLQGLNEARAFVRGTAPAPCPAPAQRRRRSSKDLTTARATGMRTTKGGFRGRRTYSPDGMARPALPAGGTAWRSALQISWMNSGG